MYDSGKYFVGFFTQLYSQVSLTLSPTLSSAGPKSRPYVPRCDGFSAIRWHPRHPLSLTVWRPLAGSPFTGIGSRSSGAECLKMYVTIASISTRFLTSSSGALELERLKNFGIHVVGL